MIDFYKIQLADNGKGCIFCGQYLKFQSHDSISFYRVCRNCSALVAYEMHRDNYVMQIYIRVKTNNKYYAIRLYPTRIISNRTRIDYIPPNVLDDEVSVISQNKVHNLEGRLNFEDGEVITLLNEYLNVTPDTAADKLKTLLPFI